MSDAVLEFTDVAVEGGHPYDTGLWQVSFRLNRGELLLVHLESGHLRNPLADTAEGLNDPLQGEIRFLGDAWRDMSHLAAIEARAKIGRVFDEPAWLSELDMDENIILAQRHHTRRADEAIRDEASELARTFSLPGLPQGRSSTMRPADLRRAACVRALLGDPTLLILERPTAGVYPDIMPVLMTCLSAARSRGTAVLWVTEDWDVWNDRGIRPTLRSNMSGSQMRVLPGA